MVLKLNKKILIIKRFILIFDYRQIRCKDTTNNSNVQGFGEKKINYVHIISFLGTKK